MRNRYRILIFLFTGMGLLSGNAGEARSGFLSGILSDTLTANPQQICQGVPSQLNAQVTGGTPPYSFLWFPGTALSDSLIADPVATPMSSIWYHVRIADNAGDTLVDSILITVNIAPPSPGLIYGPASVCIYSSANYTVNPVPGATSYSWTVPAGAIITEGQNTPSIVVVWDTTGGIMSVIAENACGLSNPCILPVTLFDLPQVPAEIYGPGDLCRNAPGSFSVASIPDVENYFWTVPSGAYITQGQGTPMIDVLWGDNAGDITVVTQNPCGNSSPESKTVNIDSVPGLPLDITGKDTVCSNHAGYVYSIPPLEGALSYKWIVPAGAEITGTADSNLITVDFGAEAASGNITVYGMNNCGSSPGQSKFITVNDCTGLSENKMDSPFFLTNGPGEKWLTLVFTKPATAGIVEILGVNGKQVFYKKMEDQPPGQKVSLDLSSLSTGVYILEFISSEQTYILKFLLP